MTDIQSINFSILNSNDLRKYSVLNVNSHDLFEKNIPKSGGLCDLRLGTIDREYKCLTCKQGPIQCPGHFGHIELAEPVYNVLFVKYITKILQSVCIRCSSLLNETDKIALNRKLQYKITTDSCKNKSKCPTCEYIQPKIILDNFIYYFQNEEEEKKQLSMSNILSIFSKITESTCKKLGFSDKTKPTDLILTCFPVAPPQVRPSIIIDSSIKSQDDLTYKLIEIIKTNNLLIKAKQSDKENIVNELSNLLQYHISTYIDNGISGIPAATQRTVVL
jgi:DNA-directed RNA polymerase, beta'' subunit/160 kD subunit